MRNQFESFLADAPETYWRHLHLAHKSMLDELLNNAGLANLGQPFLLVMLAKNEDGTVASQKDLAEWLHVTPATITVSLRSLERKGYVTKSSDTSDLRRKRITITDTGREAAKKVLDVYSQLDSAMYQGFTAEEREAVARYFRRMVENLRDLQNER